MLLATRPYVTGGVAIVGASLIAVAPVAAPLPALPDLQSPAMRLTAGEGFFDAWADVFNTASANGTTLANNFLLAPAVGLQQALVNQQDLWQEVADGTKTFQE